MDIIKRSLNITKTIKNVTRFREIISVFAQNGLDEFIIRSGLHKVIPNFILPSTRINAAMKELEGASWPSVIGHRLRRSFEELGPSFIKLGQLLSTREDVFPDGFIEQMKYLQDSAKGVSFNQVVEVINGSLEKDHSEIFQSIDSKPIGTASIGLVYRAQLKNGEDVVVKVRRPNIENIIPADFAIMEFIAERLEKASDEIKYLGISRVIQEFANSLQEELDFRREALNCKKARQNLSLITKNKVFYIPKVYEEFTRENLIILEELKGVPFSRMSENDKNSRDIEEKLEKGVHIFIKTLLADGFFHADLHAGNFFLLENGRVGLIDFGLMGHLSKKAKVSLISILYSITTHDYDNLVLELLDVADYNEIPDVDQLTRDIKRALSGFIGLSVSQINLSLLLSQTARTLSRHKMYLPREWFVIFRALITLDGVGKSIGMDIDIFPIIEKNLAPVVGEVLSKENFIEEGIFASRDFINSLRVLPRHIRWFTKELARNNYAFQIIHSGHEKPLKDLKNAIIFFGYSFIAGIFLVSGILTIDKHLWGDWHSISRPTWIFWSLGLILFIKGMRTIKN